MDDTAAQVATATANAIAAEGGGSVFAATATGDTIRISNVVSGAATDSSDNDTGLAISTVTQGQDEGLYFTLSTPSDHYHVWYDIDDLLSDPSPTVNAIEVDILSTDSAAQVAAKTTTAISNKADFDASVIGGATITISNVEAGTATDSATGTATGVTISKRIDGGNGVNYLHRNGYDLDGVQPPGTTSFPGHWREMILQWIRSLLMIQPRLPLP